MTGSASDLAHRLGDHAEAVCREYLSNGHRSGNHWIVGDVRNTRGRSMHVRLKANAKGPAGKWVEYVAPGIMLRASDGAWFWRRSTAFAQHNLSAREVG
ncbi:hypothetical protein EB232_34385 (plasmid) [Mesorhizobium sp. NZP2077]|uniref:hypothetical protein n=1 Tax=Mesorhizobium carmichaelinearum TaxID=1208188 RepID=UPI000BA4BDA3|nr:hypothetical protein EB232_34385 [Mesorhizobium sp. NZP2077]QKD20445.1 hypothetical protein HGP13_36350 [Mesorhizobium sp. NZP2077]